MGRKSTSKFPAAKIKKIIQQNQQIGKLCNSVPPVIERSLQIFLDDIMEKVNKIVETYGINKVSLSALKMAVEQSKYGFMKDVLEEVEDLDKTGRKTKRDKEEKEVREVKEGKGNSNQKAERKYKEKEQKGKGKGKKEGNREKEEEKYEESD